MLLSSWYPLGWIVSQLNSKLQQPWCSRHHRTCQAQAIKNLRSEFLPYRLSCTVTANWVGGQESFKAIFSCFVFFFILAQMSNCFVAQLRSAPAVPLLQGYYAEREAEKRVWFLSSIHTEQSSTDYLFRQRKDLAWRHYKSCALERESLP